MMFDELDDAEGTPVRQPDEARRLAARMQVRRRVMTGALTAAVFLAAVAVVGQLPGRQPTDTSEVTSEGGRDRDEDREEDQATTEEGPSTTASAPSTTEQPTTSTTRAGATPTTPPAAPSPSTTVPSGNPPPTAPPTTAAPTPPPIPVPTGPYLEATFTQEHGSTATGRTIVEHLGDHLWQGTVTMEGAVPDIEHIVNVQYRMADGLLSQIGRPICSGPSSPTGVFSCAGTFSMDPATPPAQITVSAYDPRSNGYLAMGYGRLVPGAHSPGG